MAYRKTAATAARKDARHRLFLDTAIRLFGTYGYHATTVPMIVTAADCSVGSFYLHFRNKEEVFSEVLEELGEKVAEVLNANHETEPDPLRRIPGAVEALFLFLAEHPEEARILVVESSGLSPQLEKIRRAILRRQAEQVEHTIETDPDRFAVADAGVAAHCLVGAVYEALCAWMEQDPARRQPAVAVAQAVAGYNTRALRR